MSADDQREQRAALDLDALEEMREAAETTGVWIARIHDRGHSWLVEGCSEWERAATCDHESDARLIAAMSAALPDIIAAARERDQLRATVERADKLLRYALHLRMYGERAPGGNETWRQFDTDVEHYLRGDQP